MKRNASKGTPGTLSQRPEGKLFTTSMRVVLLPFRLGGGVRGGFINHSQGLPSGKSSKNIDENPEKFRTK